MSVRRWVFVCTAAILAAPRLLVAQPVGVEFQVNTYTSSRQIYPSVAYDADGDFVVVWTSNRGGLGAYEEISGQRYASSGAALGTEFRVNTYSYSTQNASDVAVEDNGDFVVVWRSRFQDGYGYGIFGQRFASSGAKVGSELQVNTATNFDQFNAEVASDSVGNFVVVWNSYNGLFVDSGVVGQRYDSTGTSLGANFQVNTFTVNSQNLPAVAMDGEGDFVVVWSSYGQDGSGYGVFGQRFASSGAAIGAEFQVNTYTPSAQFAPSIATENNGDFVVTWASYYQDGSYSGVFGQRYASGGAPIGSEFQVNTYTMFLQRFVDTASDRQGGFIVTWSSEPQDASGSGVFGRRYGSDGNAIGGEFQINSFTDQNQERSAVAIAGDGAFVVAWQSYTQDGSDRGIFAQRYAAPPPCPDTPDPGCATGFGKGLFLAKEKVAGKEKLIAKFLKGPSTAQTDFGNPLNPGGTKYDLCIYADTTLVSTIEVDRAADATCSGGATDCWVDVGGTPPGGKGYKYKDDDAASDGVSQIQLKSGAAKILVKGRGSNLPLPIASTLTSAASVTLQLRGNDAPQCFGVTLSDFKAQDADFVKVK